MCKYLFNMGISFYIKFFTFFLYLSIFMCKYLFSMGISFHIKFFTFFLYLLFLCVSRVCNCLRYQVRHFYDISRQERTLPKFYWFLLLKMPYTGNFFLYYIFYFHFIFIILYLSFLCVSIYLVWEFPFSY